MSISNETLWVGRWLVEPSLFELRAGETTRRLEPQVMRLLQFLAARSPEVVSRDTIFDVVWDGRTVVDETLTRAVSLLRQALGDDAKQPRYIETIPTRGYRLIARVEPVSSSRGEAPTIVSSATSPPTTSPALGRPWLLIALLLTLVAALWLALPWDDGATPIAPAVVPSLAVVPFDNLSGDPADIYLSDGLTEELIHQLAGIAGLRVVSRYSSMRLRDADEPAMDVARRLGIAYLLEGSVLVVEGRARINARLIRLDHDEHLFSRTYDRELAGILALQRTVARDVVLETQVRLTAAEHVRLSVDEPVDPEAYRLFLQATHAIRRRTPEDFEIALTLLRRAVDRAPDFALAWSGLADARLLSLQYRLPGSTFADAEVAIEQALALDPGSAQAHTASGLLLVLRDQDWPRAEVAFRRALALQPSDATAHRRYSEMLALEGRYPEAVAEARMAVELDPLSPLALAAYGHRLSSAKRFRDAARELEAAEALGASFTWHLRELSHVRTRLGDEAGAAMARRADVDRQRATRAELTRLDAMIARGGLDGYWEWRRAQLLAAADAHPFQLAEAHAALGLEDEALRYVAEAVETDRVWFLHGQRSPAFDALRDDPRYLALVRDLPLWRP